MRYAFLLSDDVHWASAVRRRLTRVHRVHPRYLHCLDWGTIEPGGADWIIQSYTRYVDEIEAIVAGDGLDASALRGALGAIDIGSQCLLPDEIDAMSRQAWPTLVAMLVLTFPEIHWVFRTPFRAAHRSSDEESLAFDCLHICDTHESLDSIVTLLAAGHQALFDPTGLRNGYRQRLASPPPPRRPSDAIVRPRRTAVAASIDEEEGYAFFTAYTAYRIGYRAHVVTTYSLLRRLFAVPENSVSPLPRLDVVFEDIFLNFPDRPLGTHLSDFDHRAIEFPKLREATSRIFVSSGPHGAAPSTAVSDQANAEHLSRLEAQGVRIAWLPKPLSGFYDIWSRSELKANNKPEGYAAGFDARAGWHGDEADASGHSTPGRLYAIAVNLLRRSQRLEQSAISVADLLHSALLALEAQELLATRTPTTSLEAIAQKHNSEVRAECAFHGVEYHLDVESRLDELGKEVKGVSQWFTKETRHKSELHATADILGLLMQRFRDSNQYDEEQCVHSKLRDVHRKIVAVEHPRKMKAFGFLLTYAHWLMESPWNFAQALLLWTEVYWLVFILCPADPALPVGKHVLNAAYEAVMTFVSAQPPADLHNRSLLISFLGTFGIVASLFHFGIFVSYLYGVVARR